LWLKKYVSLEFASISKLFSKLFFQKLALEKSLEKIGLDPEQGLLLAEHCLYSSCHSPFLVWDRITHRLSHANEGLDLP
jgi:hypothetical protein